MAVIVKEKKKGSGIWWLFIYHQGQRRTKKVGDKETAELIAKRLNAKIVLNEFSLTEEGEEETSQPFAMYAQSWIETHAKALRSKTTIDRYQGLLKNHLIPHLGTKPITTITRGDIQRALLTIYKKRAKSTVDLCLALITGTMEMAVDDGIIESNPAIGVLKKLGIKRKPARISPFTSEEVPHILETAQRTMPERYPFFLTAFRTGARMGEILALRWMDINFGENYINIHRSFRTELRNTTKTNKIRRVDMSNQLTAELQKQWQKRQTGEGGRATDLIFAQNGGFWPQNSVRNYWRRLLKQAEIPYQKFHSIRHTYATLLLQNNQSLAYVKEQLGHTSIQMTVDIYGHLVQGSNRAAVNALDTP